MLQLLNYPEFPSSLALLRALLDLPLDLCTAPLAPSPRQYQPIAHSYSAY
jgi:hypothetical protein